MFAPATLDRPDVRALIKDRIDTRVVRVRAHLSRHTPGAAQIRLRDGSVSRSASSNRKAKRGIR
jgi:hypothetical protein